MPSYLLYKDQLCICCMYSTNICMYVNNLLDDSIVSCPLSVEFSYIISLEIFTLWQGTMAHYKDFASTIVRMEISSIHQFSFCVQFVRSYIKLSVQCVTYLIFVYSMCIQFCLQFLQYSLQFCVVQQYLLVYYALQFKYKVLQVFVA